MRNFWKHVTLFVVTFVAAFGVVSCSVAVGSRLVPDPEGDAARATVWVGNDDGHGSGVVIAPNRVITAGHVVGDNTTMQIKLSTGEKKLGHVVWIGKGSGNDLALIEVDTGNIRPGRVACNDTHRGERVFSFGYPLWAQEVMTWGRVASDRHVVDEQTGIRATLLDMTIVPGNSGGGIWTENGELVGLAEAVMVVPLNAFSASLSGLSLMTPSTAICKLLGRSS